MSEDYCADAIGVIGKIRMTFDDVVKGFIGFFLEDGINAF